jgi:hypothetical protein
MYLVSAEKKELLCFKIVPSIGFGCAYILSAK